MVDEASKTRGLLSSEQISFLVGRGIDIGCGPDPVVPDCERFDLEHGDANQIGSLRDNEAYDYVFSSHCLEHMHQPSEAILQWWSLVRPGGYLIFLVPDEDYYEQGYWPSLFNPDHKATFTMHKQQSWSDCSYNISDLLSSLPQGRIHSMSLQLNNYSHALHHHSFYTRSSAVFLLRIRGRLIRSFPFMKKVWVKAFSWLNVPYDQTQDNATAQILSIVQKAEGEWRLFAVPVVKA